MNSSGLWDLFEASLESRRKNDPTSGQRDLDGINLLRPAFRRSRDPCKARECKGHPMWANFPAAAVDWTLALDFQLLPHPHDGSKPTLSGTECRRCQITIQLKALHSGTIE